MYRKYHGFLHFFYFQFSKANQPKAVVFNSVLKKTHGFSMHFYLQQKGAPSPPGAVELGGGSGAGFQARLFLSPED